MTAMASQITSLTIVYSNFFHGQIKESIKAPASLAFVRGIHRWPMNSPHKGPVTRKIFQFDDVIMCFSNHMGDVSRVSWWRHQVSQSILASAPKMMKLWFHIYTLSFRLSFSDKIETIIWTNAGLLLMEPFGTNFGEIRSKTLNIFHMIQEMNLKIPSA